MSYHVKLKFKEINFIIFIFLIFIYNKIKINNNLKNILII